MMLNHAEDSYWTDWFSLSLTPRLGSRKIQNLFEHFGSIQAIVSASVQQLRSVVGIELQLAQNIRQNIESGLGQQELAHAKNLGIKLINFTQESYPQFLQEIYDLPPILYQKGEINWNEGFFLGFVGTRKASHYGKEQTAILIRQLAEKIPNLIIVSGLALGIDSVAHRTALECGLKTVAVLAGGLSQIYPPQNWELSEKIIRQGALLTEIPIQSKPIASNFPLRNRIISGLSRGSVVIEAGEKSGALITAKYTLDQNRELFALPGPVNSPFCKGTNRLIQRGHAKLIIGAQDIFEEFPDFLSSVQTSLPPQAEPSKPLLSEEEQKIVDFLKKGEAQMDTLVQALQFPIGKLMANLTALEMKGVVISKVGGWYQSLIF